MKSINGTEMIECPPIDRDAMEMDDSGYWFLIRVSFRYGHIEVAVCHKEVVNTPMTLDDDGENKKHIKEIFFGKCAQDIYHKILRETEYVNYLTHAAYLGKELKKAEIALALGIKDHYQE